MGLGVTLIVSDLLLVYYFFIFPFIIVIPLWLAVRYPFFRSGIGLITLTVSIIGLFIEVMISSPVGFMVTSGFFGAVYGLSLLVWGLRSRSSGEAEEMRSFPGLCPRCGEDLSFLPGDAKVCPYCRALLA